MKIAVLFGLLVVFACQHSTLTTRTKLPICIDNRIELNHVVSNMAFEELFLGRKYYPLYMGQEEDTIVIDYKFAIKLGIKPPLAPPPPLPPTPGMSAPDTLRAIDIAWKKKLAYWKQEAEKYSGYLGKEWEDSDQYRFIEDRLVEIDFFVDTSHYLLTIDNRTFTDSSHLLRNYPVIIKNKELDTIIVGFGGRIPLILEEEKEDENWKILENAFRRDGGHAFLLLPPNEVLVTAIPVFKWEQKKVLRLKLGNNYTLPFRSN